jgi:uncharacterized protein YraI
MIKIAYDEVKFMSKNFLKSLVIIFTAASIISVPFTKPRADTLNTITRSQVELRAKTMMDLKWTYSAAKNSLLNSNYKSYVTQPKQLQNITTSVMTGIPYNWGGLDGIDSYSYNTGWTSFLDAINKGAYAGNVNIEAGYGLIGGTAGIDCSGFVQAAYNIHDYKLSTSTLFNKYFVKIPLSDIKHMDILDRPGDHVVIFDRWGTLNGIQGAFTYESTPDQVFGGIQGTKRYFITMDDINNGYIPGRYINIVDDAEAQQASPAPTQQFAAGSYVQVANVTNYANLRTSPTTASTIITTIPKNTILKLTSYSNGWYQVNYNGKTGWIRGDLLSAVPAGRYVTVKDAYQLNVRLSSSTAAQIIGTITQGQYAEKLSQTADGSWYKVSINGVQGWSSSRYLTFLK